MVAERNWSLLVMETLHQKVVGLERSTATATTECSQLVVVEAACQKASVTLINTPHAKPLQCGTHHIPISTQALLQHTHDAHAAALEGSPVTMTTECDWLLVVEMEHQKMSSFPDNMPHAKLLQKQTDHLQTFKQAQLAESDR